MGRGPGAWGWESFGLGYFYLVECRRKENSTYVREYPKTFISS